MAAHDDVEKVARALARKAKASEMGDAGFIAEHVDDYVTICWRDHIDRAEAAIATMAPINEMWIGDYMLRLAPNGVWIGRPGGEGGEFATEHVERVIAQFYREQF